MKIIRLLTLAGLLATLVGATPAAAQDQCIACHKDPKFKVQNPKLFYYYQDFASSVHGVAGLSCSDCHGGDAGTTDLKKAHFNVLQPVAFDQVPETCGECHEQQHDTFITSKHYKVLEDNGTAPNCVTCHGAMEMDFIFVTRVRNTCAFCHNRETGNLPEVPDRADYVLNKINIMKGYRSFVNTYAADQVEAKVLEDQYTSLVARWHRFDLEQVETDAKTLLGNYRLAKAQAMKDRRTR